MMNIIIILLLCILIVYTFVVYAVVIMKTISLKIDDTIFQETEMILGQLKKPRNRYINQAIDFYNKHQKRKLLEVKLRNESGLVGDESMKVLKDFEDLDYDEPTV